MNELQLGLWQIVILGFFGVLSPAVVALVAAVVARQQAREQRMWQKESAELAASAAREASDRAEKASQLLLESNDRVAQRAHGLSGQLVVIHDLVNSDMTARIESELAGLVREEELMTRLMEANRKAGQDPTILELKELGATQARIVERTQTLNKRKEQQAAIDEQKRSGGVVLPAPQSTMADVKAVELKVEMKDKP